MHPSDSTKPATEQPAQDAPRQHSFPQINPSAQQATTDLSLEELRFLPPLPPVVDLQTPLAAETEGGQSGSQTAFNNDGAPSELDSVQALLGGDPDATSFGDLYLDQAGSDPLSVVSIPYSLTGTSSQPLTTAPSARSLDPAFSGSVAGGFGDSNWPPRLGSGTVPGQPPAVGASRQPSSGPPSDTGGNPGESQQQQGLGPPGQGMTLRSSGRRQQQTSGEDRGSETALNALAAMEGNPTTSSGLRAGVSEAQGPSTVGSAGEVSSGLDFEGGASGMPVMSPPTDQGGAGTGGDNTELMGLSLVEQRRARKRVHNRNNQARYRQRSKEQLEELQKEVEGLRDRVNQVTQEKSAAESSVATLQARIRELEAAGAGQRQLEQQEDAGINSRLASSLSMAMSVAYRRPFSLSVEDLDNMDEARVGQLYQDAITELARCLLEGAADDVNCPAYARLNVIVQSMREANTLAYPNTTRFRVAGMRLVRGLPTRGEQGPVPPAMWRIVIDKLELTDAQRRALCAARQQFGAAHTAILIRRQQMLRTLLEDMPAQYSPAQNGQASMEKMLAGSRALRESIREENMALGNFNRYVHQTVLSVLQEARLYVELYPWRTESVGMCDILLQDTPHM